MQPGFQNSTNHHDASLCLSNLGPDLFSLVHARVEKDVWSIVTVWYDGESLQTFGYSGLGFRIPTCFCGIENGLWTFGYKQYSHVSFTLGPWHLACFICNLKVLTSIHL